jgi:hypothetical protein
MVQDIDLIYQRIGEFVVSFQGLENRIREIGWFILDPKRVDWPPKGLRNLDNKPLVDKVHKLFQTAIVQCRLDAELEAEFKKSFASYTEVLHQLRRVRNNLLHSAFIELKGGGEVRGIMRSSPRLQIEEETGEVFFDQELLTENSFSSEMLRMVDAQMFLNRAYIQLIHRYQNGNAGLTQVAPDEGG